MSSNLIIPKKMDSDFFNMVFVAEWFRRKFVALVYAGSNPVEHPNKKKDNKKFGIFKYFLYLCIVFVK